MIAIQSSRRIHKLAVVLLALACTSLVFRYQTVLPEKVQDQIPKVFRPQEVPHYSIKPIAYVFPQYYAFDENDKIWGFNFTEWDNVREVTHNAHGLETIRPHESVGFYNGLELKTRKRQGKFLRDHGFYGAVYHHYWFAGKPVMDGVIRAMLEDGEPNTPFMLSWANEPWTKRWDGEDSSEVFIAQDYGLIDDWRAHFEWLLPFFRHPQYIRSEGRIQFMVYKPSHIGDRGPLIFAAWRQWAIDEGLGGMDIIETRWGSDRWNNALPDAVNEFQPHVAGFDHARHPLTNRISRTYHRGTLVCWDSTPRHSTDGQGSPQPFCHPKTWQYHMVEMFRKIKSDPNPLGAENFLFINALNEWGEGNALEPSVQFEDGYGIAMKNAIAISNKLHSWPDANFKGGLQRTLKVKANLTVTSTDGNADMDDQVAIEEGSETAEQADICVLIRTDREQANDRVYKLSAMLESLQAQRNTNWRAVVFEPHPSGFTDIEETIFRAYDPRIELKVIPEEAHLVIAYEEDENHENSEDGTPHNRDEIRRNIEEVRKQAIKDDAGMKATDWIIGNLTKTPSLCGSAKYLLITSAANTYSPNAFDAVINAETDLVGLNVESQRTIWNQYHVGASTWSDRCVRLADKTSTLCNSSAPTAENFDLSATFINFPAFIEDGFAFSEHSGASPRHQDWALIDSLVHDHEWTWSGPKNTKSCHVMHNPTYTTCYQTGNIWFDSPIYNQTGCYTASDFNDKFGPSFNKYDLEYFRLEAYCLRFKAKAFREFNSWNETDKFYQEARVNRGDGAEEDDDWSPERA